MHEADAVELINWFPETDGISIRPGYEEHATGVGSGDVEFAHEYHGRTTRDLIAGGGGHIYDATTAGAATSLASGFTSNQWQATNFGDRLLMVNGVDAPQSYNGTTVAAAAFTGPTTPSDLIQITNFKSRVWAVEKDTADAWYGATSAVTGALTVFPISEIAKLGGELQAIGSWSRDSGDGLDDLLVFVMSSGEVLVYAGTNPASDFQLIGSYVGAEPIGRRCLTRVGGDLIILTRVGYLPVSMLLQGGTADSIDRHPIWGRVRKPAQDAASLYGGNFGWQAFESSTGGALYFNIPVNEGTQYDQHVLNTVTGAWAKYEDLPAVTWATYDNDIYFGGTDGTVWKHAGSSDNGTPVDFLARSSFDYLGARDRQKSFTMARALISVDGTVSGVIGANVDFATDPPFPVNTVNFSSDLTGSEWDAELWDDAVWGGGAELFRDWVTIGGFGYSIGLRFQGSADAKTLKWFGKTIGAKFGGRI